MSKNRAARIDQRESHLRAVPDLPPATRSSSMLAWLPVALLSIVALGLYARTLNADFLRWDDRQNILLNPWIENGALSLIWTRPYYNMYIPITYTLWTALWHMTPQPWLFHLANVLFHVGNTVLVYMIARQWLKKDEKLAAVLAALIFCCHPLQVETVAWISTFRDTVACFLSLLAVWWITNRKDRIAIAGSTILFCAALLSKPSVAVVPAAMLFLAWGLGRLDRARAITYGLWFIPALAASYVTKSVQQLDADLRLPPMDLGDRLLVAVDALTFYVSKFFVPYPLAADYGRTRDVALDGDLWIAGLIAAGVIAAALWAFRRHVSRRAVLFVGFFVLFLAPVLGVIPFQAQGQTTVSDRYVYMSLIGLGLALGPLLARKTLWPLASVVVVGLMALTVARVEVWQGNEVFFRDMLAKNERSHVALSSLGVEFILTNRLDEAEAVLNRAVALRPKDVIPRTNLAQLYLLKGAPARVTSEIEPLLNDKDFLYQNQTETRALASVYRLTARANWAQSLWSGANDYFCRWFKLDYENEEGKLEIQRFLEDARKHGAYLRNCELGVR